MLPFGREVALRPAWCAPVGPRWMARRIAARSCLCAGVACPVFLWPAAGGALDGLPAASTLTRVMARR